MTNSIIPENEAEAYLNLRLVPLSTKLQRLVQRHALRPLDLQMQEWRILLSLGRFGDSHLKLIAERAALDFAHASRAAAGIEKKGLITMTPDKRDARRKVLSLTRQGKATLLSAWDIASDFGNQLREIYTEEEFATLNRLLDRAIEQTDEMLNQ